MNRPKFIVSYQVEEPIRIQMDVSYSRPLVKSAYQKNNFLISQPKHMLWVLKRTVSMRRLIWVPKTYA